MVDIIQWLILIPLVGALLVAVAPRELSRPLAAVVNVIALGVVLAIAVKFDVADGTLQFVSRCEWIPAIGAEFFLGADGLSLLLLLLTSLIVPFGLLAPGITDGRRGFTALMLFMQAALFGTFTAQNFILWFLFYEMSLIPAFLLVKLWGGANRDRAATRFFVFTFLGSAAMLVAFLGVYLAARTFDFTKFAEIGQAGLLPGAAGWWIFAGVFIGLAVKVPVFPFHTWLPDTYQSAPPGVSMVLTGVLSKMGVYGFIRLVLPLFPHEIQQLRPLLLTLAVASIVLSTLAAWAQTDLKRMVAYISINHLGYCMLALFAVASAAAPSVADTQAALAGVFMQIFNHGITAAALFYFVGLLEVRRGRTALGDFGGLMQRTPQLCAWMALAMFSSLGLPGLNGFIGEILIFKGAFGLAPVATACAAFGLLITAVVFLRAMKLISSGPLAASCENLPELTAGEKLVVIPASLLMLVLGVAPQFMFRLINATVAHMGGLFG